MKRGVSVIVCCYNSANRIRPTLQHISAQEVSIGIPWEVILVNNNSSDNTKDIAKEAWEETQTSIPFQIVDEPTPGLMSAKATGIKTAQYDYLLICDDDNWLNKNYVQLAYEIMEANPHIGILGSRSEAVAEVELPFWFSTYQKAFAVGVQALNSGDLTDHGKVWGAGMVFRKSIYLKLKEIGFLHMLTGRKGEKLSGGEDMELCCWFVLAGFKLWYSEDLVLKHFIDRSRLNKAYLQKLQENFSISGVPLSRYRLLIDRRKVNSWQLVLRWGLSFVRYIRDYNDSEHRIKNEIRLTAYSLTHLIPWDKETYRINRIMKTIKGFNFI